MRGRRDQDDAAKFQSSILAKVEGKGLIYDAQTGDLSSMKKRLRNSIFKKPEDINQKDDRCCCPIHYAAKNSHKAMVKFLVGKGAEINVEDKHGWSPLQYAVRYGDADTVILIISLDASLIDHSEHKGWTALHIAARNGQPDKARILLEHGADVNVVQQQGWNALHLAVRFGQPDTISILLEYGIDINANNVGWTALHLAALNGHTDIVSILLNKGADLEALNPDNKTALDIARIESQYRIVAIILEREFQSKLDISLPSPPLTPTLPSAPVIPLESCENDETISQWKLSFNASMEEEEDGPSEICIKWKSFEEEEKELMKQLESVRLNEYTNIKNKMIKLKNDHSEKLARMERLRVSLIKQMAALKEEEPIIHIKSEEFCAQVRQRAVDLNHVMEKIDRESVLLRSLLDDNGQENLFAHAAWCDKRKLLDEIVRVQEKEKMECQIALLRTKDDIEKIKADSLRNISVSQNKQAVLMQKIEKQSLLAQKVKGDHMQSMALMQEQLEKAERKSILSHSEVVANGDDSWFCCPVCMELLKPPLRIFQCSEGHILCEECKENPAIVHCPQCRALLEGNCSRNRALEEISRSYFPMAPSETL